MSWKEFLKPKLNKIAFFVIFFILSSLPFLFPSTLFPTITSVYNETCGWADGICVDMVIGLPLPFYVQTSGGIAGGVYNNLLFVFLIIDLAFWYLVSCIIILVYNKVKKK